MNQTLVTEIVLLGFQHLNNLRIPFFSLILLIYILAFCANVLIIVLVSASCNLQSPMYLFLQQLSLCDLLQTTTIVPILLKTVINGKATLSVGWCITQFYCYAGSEALECLLLTVMSFDRYVAICNPLRYSSLIDHKFCLQTILILWLIGFGLAIVTTSALSTLHFCKINTINHFFCDLSPLLEISCSDANFVQMEAVAFSFLVIIAPFIIVLVSYIFIAHAIIKMVTNSGRQKAFSTCSSHLAVVSIYYGTLTGTYAVPSQNKSVTISKVISLLYTVGTPLLNPMIYSLKNQNMNSSFTKVVSKWTTHISQ